MIRIPAIIAALLLCACTPSTPPTVADDALGATSLCADSYLLALAPERIAALSWQAGSSLSTAPDEMAHLPKLWNSREVLARTNLALVTGPGDTTQNRDHVLPLQWGEDFETVRTNAVRLRDAFGIDISSFEAELDAVVDLPRPDRAQRVLYLSRSGGSAGPGTFVDAVITAAGGDNVNATPGWHTPSVERVLQYEPDLILTSFFGSDYAGANDRAVRHAALRAFIVRHERFDLPGRLWPCAGPGLTEAARRLHARLMSP